MINCNHTNTKECKQYVLINDYMKNSGYLNNACKDIVKKHHVNKKYYHLKAESLTNNQNHSNDYATSKFASKQHLVNSFQNMLLKSKNKINNNNDSPLFKKNKYLQNSELFLYKFPFAD